MVEFLHAPREQTNVILARVKYSHEKRDNHLHILMLHYIHYYVHVAYLIRVL